MRCNEVRKHLLSGVAASSVLRNHLEDCKACARYAARLETAQGWFREHHGGFVPDASFSARVAARLPRSNVDVLGWAALRVLPATLMIAAVLGWMVVRDTPGTNPSDAFVADSPAEDLLTWVIEEEADG